MYDFFPKGMSTINVVVLGVRSGKIVPVVRFRLAKSRIDMAKHFALKTDGEPVLGPRHYRERTKKEIKEAGLEGHDYLSTLVPLCSGEPYLQGGIALPLNP